MAGRWVLWPLCWGSPPSQAGSWGAAVSSHLWGGFGEPGGAALLAKQRLPQRLCASLRISHGIPITHRSRLLVGWGAGVPPCCPMDRLCLCGDFPGAALPGSAQVAAASGTGMGHYKDRSGTGCGRRFPCAAEMSWVSQPRCHRHGVRERGCAMLGFPHAQEASQAPKGHYRLLVPRWDPWHPPSPRPQCGPTAGGTCGAVPGPQPREGARLTPSPAGGERRGESSSAFLQNSLLSSTVPVGASKSSLYPSRGTQLHRWLRGWVSPCVGAPAGMCSQGREVHVISPARSMA